MAVINTVTPFVRVNFGTVTNSNRSRTLESFQHNGSCLIRGPSYYHIQLEVYRWSPTMQAERTDTILKPFWYCIDDQNGFSLEFCFQTLRKLMFVFCRNSLFIFFHRLSRCSRITVMIIRIRLGQKCVLCYPSSRFIPSRSSSNSDLRRRKTIANKSKMFLLSQPSSAKQGICHEAVRHSPG
jgi:hypothetical protein